MLFLRFAEWARGPSGVKVLDWLDQRGLWVFGIVLVIAVLAFVFPRPRARIAAWLTRAREKLGLAPTEEERVRLRELRERRMGPERGKKARKGTEQTGKGKDA